MFRTYDTQTDGRIRRAFVATDFAHENTHVDLNDNATYDAIIEQARASAGGEGWDVIDVIESGDSAQVFEVQFERAS